MIPRRFDPLDYGSLAKTLADRLMESELAPLSEVERFDGSGIYALFYEGRFPAYQKLARINSVRPGSFPIYIGEAVPKTLTGKSFEFADDTDSTKDRLYRRIRHHMGSLTKAENLDVGDFSCKMLVLRPMWVPLAESALIGTFVPVWNSVVPGFGNHDPGRGRGLGMLSDWDVLHPGRGLRGIAPDDPEQKAKEIARRARQAIRDRSAILGLDSIIETIEVHVVEHDDQES